MAKAGDTFVEATSVDLLAHTPTGPDAGAGWALAITANGDVDVDSVGDQAVGQDGSGNRVRMTTDLGYDSMDVSADVSFTVADTTKFAGPCGRLSTSSGAGVEFLYDESGGQWYLDDNAGLTDSLVEAWSAGTMLLQIRPGDMRGFVGGVEKVSIASNAKAGNHYGGLLLGKFGGTGFPLADNYASEGIFVPPTGGSDADDRYRFRNSVLWSGTSTLGTRRSAWPDDADDPSSDAAADNYSRTF